MFCLLPFICREGWGTWFSLAWNWDQCVLPPLLKSGLVLTPSSLMFLVALRV